MAGDFKFSEHVDKYPPVIPRAKVNRYFPWLSQKRLANLDKLGQGPSHAFKNGRAILYPTWSFLKWLDDRTRPQETKQAQEKPESNPKRKSADPPTARRGRKTKEQEVRERRR